MKKTALVAACASGVFSIMALVKVLTTTHLIAFGHRPALMYDPETEARILQSALSACGVRSVAALVATLVAIVTLASWHLKTRKL